MKFNQNNARALKCPEGKSDHTEWDEDMPGFGIRFRNGKPGVYVIRYSLNGHQSRLALGRVSQVNLVDAQKKAKQHFGEAASGQDPALQRATASSKGKVKFGDKVGAYIKTLEEADLSPGYISDHRRNLERYMKELHRFSASEVTRAQIAEQLDAIEEEHGFRQAGLARAQVHKFYNWLISKGLLDINPASGTEKRASVRRERVLDPAELVEIWHATGSDDEFDRIVRLLILTAARKTQIGSLNRKTELKLSKGLLDFVPPHVRAERGQDTSDRGKTKNKERFWLALSTQAKAILEKVPTRIGSDFVFGEGEGGFSGWSKCKERLDEKLGDAVDAWTFHDFRRTFDSLVVDECKVAPWISDVCLNHVGEHRKGVKRTYNHAQYVDEKRIAMQAWADYIDTLVTAKELKIAA